MILVMGHDGNLEKIKREFDNTIWERNENYEITCIVFLDSVDNVEEVTNLKQDVTPSLVASRSVEAEKAAELGVDSYPEDSRLVDAIEDAVSSYKVRKDEKNAKYKLDAVLKYTPASVCFKNVDLEYEEVSERFLEEMSDEVSSSEDLKGRTDAELYGEELVEKRMKDDRRVVSEGHVVDQKREYSPRNGRQNMTSKGPVVSEKGDIRGLYGISINVTDKKERMHIMEDIQETSEKLLRSNMKNEIYTHGLESVFRLIEFRSAGYYVDIADEIRLAGSVKSFESEPKREKVEELVEEAMETRENSWDRSLGGRHVSCVNVGCHGCVAIVKDQKINEYRQEALSIVASNVEASLDRLEERQEKKKLRQLGDVISHELRNPLNIAKGYLEEFEDSVEKKQIKDSMVRMENIINDLGELAKNREAVDEIKRMELHDLAEEAWEEIETKDAELSIEGEDRFRGDRARMVEVFENIFENAVEHGGEDVNVEVGPTEDGFYIEDDGEGIPEEIKDDLFNYNFKAEQDNRGIGLSIIQKIIKGHGWDIEALESRKGGARFEIHRL